MQFTEGNENTQANSGVGVNDLQGCISALDSGHHTRIKTGKLALRVSIVVPSCSSTTSPSTHVAGVPNVGEVARMRPGIGITLPQTHRAQRLIKAT